MRNFFIQNRRIIFIIISQLILLWALWQTNRFLLSFKKEEENKMEILGAAYERLSQAGLDEDISLSQHIFNSNTTIPIIILDQDGKIVSFKNLKWDDKKHLTSKDSLKIIRLAKDFTQFTSPVVFELDNGKYHELYYGRSSLFTKLFSYPLILVVILLLFAGVIYQYYKVGKKSDENLLWSSLAKETAHQIGTPLSSLIGWVELLKTSGCKDIPVEELEKDVSRLNIISQRFSKIGSQPELRKENIVEVSQHAISYLKSRTSKLVDIICHCNKDVYAYLNKQLYAWVLENLIKNAIDAMEGKGKIEIEITEENHKVIIDIKDYGRGMTSAQVKQIFIPGYSTKKRGWGLGLSLAKRIIEEYHQGKIFVYKTKPGEGTTFRILLNKFID